LTTTLVMLSAVDQLNLNAAIYGPFGQVCIHRQLGQPGMAERDGESLLAYHSRQWVRAESVDLHTECSER
jgi:hypothetical protein